MATLKDGSLKLLIAWQRGFFVLAGQIWCQSSLDKHAEDTPTSKDGPKTKLMHSTYEDENLLSFRLQEDSHG